MRLNKLENLISVMKIHTDQAMDMIYELEGILKKINSEGVAPRLYHLTDCPPRLPSNYEEDHSVACSFYQSDFDLKKIV